MLTDKLVLELELELGLEGERMQRWWKGKKERCVVTPREV